MQLWSTHRKISILCNPSRWSSHLKQKLHLHQSPKTNSDVSPWNTETFQVQSWNVKSAFAKFAHSALTRLTYLANQRQRRGQEPQICRLSSTSWSLHTHWMVSFTLPRPHTLKFFTGTSMVDCGVWRASQTTRIRTWRKKCRHREKWKITQTLRTRLTLER